VLHGFRQNGPVYETTIADVKAGKWYFRQLFVDGARRQLARSPNSGYHRIAALIPGPPSPNAKPVARDRFIFAGNDVRPWAELSDAYVVLMHSWETSLHPIKAVDLSSRTVEFASPLKEWWTIGFWEEAQRYYAENARELLDEPGEWYLDRQTGVLSYWPLPHERMDKVNIVAPLLTELVRFAGNAEDGRFVRNITLRGLAFHHSDWVLDPKGNSSTQAAVEVPAAIVADGALDCAVERCEVAHIGTYGIWFRRGCNDCRLQQNRLLDLGAGGIRIGEANAARTDVAETSRTLVDNNHIFDGGHVFAAGIGVWVAQSSSNVISHNDIHDLLYSGMSIGWNWNDSPNRTHHNIIEYNHVHDLGHGVLSDAGLIYCLGVSPGSVIRNNIFHDMWPYSNPPFGWGIYLDATCGQYLVESNLVYNTLSGGLMYNNGGHEHIIRNNIFALSANHSIWPFFEKRPNTFSRNIVYLTQGELFIPYGQRSLGERLAAKEPLGDWDHNLYWHTGGADRLRFLNRPFAGWQQIGPDRNSRIADPGFVNAHVGDFTLTRNSPAFQLGFEPIRFGGVGLYGDASWRKECRHEDCRLKPLPAPPTRP
ncbi:MAG TPA: right-handed parallel beta-helix repeat-containing protein, partial [Verrucomicrobiae bacterium]